MDIIFLSELKVDTIIGIWEWERRIRQTVVIDLEMSADIARAAATDEVADTLNYKSVAKRIQDFAPFISGPIKSATISNTIENT